MPYIDVPRRIELNEGDTPQTPGELNYVITLLCIEYMDEHGESYTAMNDVMGAIHGAQAEFYRRVVAEYEDGKIAANGDVY